MDTARVVGPLTVDDLPPDLNGGTRHELLDGGLLVTPNPTVAHQALVWSLGRQLERQLDPAVARVLPGANVSASQDQLVIPDVLVVRTEALARDVGRLSLAPEDLLLVVEIESASTRRRDRTLKRELYAEWQVPYWLVDSGSAAVTRHGDDAFTRDLESEGP